MRLTTEGRNPTAVAVVANFGRADGERNDRHLMMTFDAHQKLATLSSKRPRAKGKMRVIGFNNADGGYNQGRNKKANVASVTTPS